VRVPTPPKLSRSNDVAQKKAPPKAKGNRTFMLLVGLLVVAGGGIITYIVKTSGPRVTVTDFPPLSDAGYLMGSDTASVELVEYADFECPQCGFFATITEPDVRQKLIEPGLVRFRFVDFPLSGHPNTLDAHNAAACANAQGRFWPMHDRIFAGQGDWSKMTSPRARNPIRVFKGYAKDLGLDQKMFDACLDSRAYNDHIMANAKAGEERGIHETPTFVIGKRTIAGRQPFDVIKAYVDSARAEAAKK
jgi:protein-disulfide isomerase